MCERLIEKRVNSLKKKVGIANTVFSITLGAAFVSCVLLVSNDDYANVFGRNPQMIHTISIVAWFSVICAIISVIAKIVANRLTAQLIINEGALRVVNAMQARTNSDILLDRIHAYDRRRNTHV